LLEAGDKVLVAGGKDSDVFAFGNMDASTVAEFVRIETESGHTVELSRLHYILIAGQLVPARTVELGDQQQSLGLLNVM